MADIRKLTETINKLAVEEVEEAQTEEIQVEAEIDVTEEYDEDLGEGDLPTRGHPSTPNL